MADRQDAIAEWKGPIYLSTAFHLRHPKRAFTPFFYRYRPFKTSL